MKIADVWYSHIVYQYWCLACNSLLLQLFKNFWEKTILLALGKISDYRIRSDELILLSECSQCILHFFLISSYHANIEALLCQFFTESQADSITSASNNGPGLFSIPLAVVFFRQNNFDKGPKQLSDEDDKPNATNDCKKVYEVEGGLFHYLYTLTM